MRYTSRIPALLAVVLLSGLVCRTQSQNYWKEIGQPTSHDLLSVSFLNSMQGWASGREGTILLTTDGGESWTSQTTGVTTDILQIRMLTDQIGWAITWVDFVDTSTYFGTRLLKTTDGGLNWIASDFPVAEEFFHAIVFRDSLHGFVGGERGSLFETTDAGITWSRANVDSTLYANFPILNLQFLTPDLGIGVGGSLDFVGVIWRTTNGGESWNAQGVGPEPVYEVHLVDSTHIVGIAGDFDWGASMVRTINRGMDWEYTYLAIFGQPRALAFRTSYEGWAPLGQQFMVTFDTARTWQVMDTPGQRTIHDLVFTDSTTGFAAGNSGAILKYYKPATGIETRDPFPHSPTLCQNYPNPFNPVTQIGYTLTEESVVRLRIFNVLGQEVVTLVDGIRPAGYSSVEWNAASDSGQRLGSGVYFCRMEAKSTRGNGSFSDMMKMLILK